MKTSDWKAVIEAAMEPARAYLESLPERRVYRPTDPDELRAIVGGALQDEPIAPETVVAELARDLDPYITAHASGRYFGFVIGGTHPAAYGAELLASTWDQNTGLYAVAQGAAMVEEVAAGWLLDLLDLPRDSSVGFVTGGQMATFTCLAAARSRVLADAGWNVESDGLIGAPHISIVCKTEKHTTVTRALRLLGLGDRTMIEVASDDNSRIDPDDLARTLATLNEPTILCLESGNVNTGAFDDFARIADIVDEHRARGNPTWVHVDGAVGLWARAAGSHRARTEGIERMDSWSTDAHKLLNVTYDSGIAICRDAIAHRTALSTHASYLIQAHGEVRDPLDWNPEFSRRARGLAVYATLRSLGRSGVEALVSRTCALAQRFADTLGASGLATIVNEVEFNQVLVRWNGDDAFNDAVTEAIQADGTAFFSGTTLRGQRMMRISVSDWATDESDVDRSVEALLRCARAVAIR